MRIGANLPEELWPEVWKTAVYLHNRSPQQVNNWKTPFQRLHQWLQDSNHDSGYLHTQPDITHLKTYGCRAYPMTPAALVGKQKKDLKTQPHAEVGYLVGYDSTNIFRIWIPEKHEVRRVRDVTFDETVLYDPKDHQQRLHIETLEPHVKLPVHIDSGSELEEHERIRPGTHVEPESQSEQEIESEDEAQSTIWVGGQLKEDNADQQLDEPGSQDSERQDDENQSSQQDDYNGKQKDASPAGTTQHEIHNRLQAEAKDHSVEQKAKKNVKRSDHELDQPKRKSTRERMPSAKAREAASGSPKKLHELNGHRFEPEFRKAMETEWTNVNRRGTVQPISRDQVAGQILPLTWVFKYKFNKQRYLQKFKARICVRGDLQPPDSRDTYAATLAGRSFQILMAITAKFDLETRQLDAVNAFTNSLLDEDVYVQFPDGYRRKGWVLKLLRALYGLRRSPLLWQKDLTAAFEKLGLKQSQEEPCLFTDNWLTVFFFVDDIVLLHRTKHRKAADEFIAKLKAQYEMNDLGELKWFLGIRVLRDRTARKLWLCQDSYIEKIANQYRITQRDQFKGNLFPTNDLQPRGDQASPDLVHRYQQKVGSINYVAVITRPDIAKATAKLAEFLQNPSERHNQLVDRVMEYLWSSRFLAMQFNGTSSGTDLIKINYGSAPRDLRIASDAAWSHPRKLLPAWAPSLPSTYRSQPSDSRSSAGLDPSTARRLRLTSKFPKSREAIMR
ncbi:hypothetical protein CDD83_8907 [Cordyceps sp. RAO-2017]|nr:hypothetical protein CDD83_8907 [Cordyceps sp. RAO-2017]